MMVKKQANSSSKRSYNPKYHHNYVELYDGLIPGFCSAQAEVSWGKTLNSYLHLTYHQCANGWSPCTKCIISNYMLLFPVILLIHLGELEVINSARVER